MSRRPIPPRPSLELDRKQAKALLDALHSGDAATPSDPDVLCDAASRNDVVLMRRLLDTGADPNAAGGIDEMPPLHSACWRGRGARSVS